MRRKVVTRAPHRASLRRQPGPVRPHPSYIYGGGIARPEGACRTPARGRACSKKAGEQAQSVAAAALANDSASVCRKGGRGASGTLENADVTAGRTEPRCPARNLKLVDAAWPGARSLMTHLCSLIW